jgi:RHS repeat-associated protein
MDVSGTLQGAGGVGGLLKAEETIGTAASSHYPWYDGNGNVVGLMRGNGTVDAVYRYSAFGGKAEVSVNSSTFAARNPYRFSTKYLDAEVETTYGYWHYATALGRWPSRDLIVERGGVNLYGMCYNNAVSFFDLLGQECECSCSMIVTYNCHSLPGGTVTGNGSATGATKKEACREAGRRATNNGIGSVPAGCWATGSGSPNCE